MSKTNKLSFYAVLENLQFEHPWCFNCETVDCMVIQSQHRISSKLDKNPSCGKKTLGKKTICQDRNSSWAETVILGSYRLSRSGLWYGSQWFPPIQHLGLICWKLFLWLWTVFSDWLSWSLAILEDGYCTVFTFLQNVMKPYKYREPHACWLNKQKKVDHFPLNQAGQPLPVSKTVGNKTK